MSTVIDAETQAEARVLNGTLRKFRRVNEIIGKHGKDPSNLIAILQDVQEEYRYLPEEIMTYISTVMEIHPSAVYGVATFYAQFSLEPKGKHVIKVCDGTACHVRNSQWIIDGLREHLRLKQGVTTTKDMLFTVETVACIGACALAPAMMVDEEIYGQLTPDKVKEIVDEIIAKEEE
ncbi:MAG: NADH-quinone oxidoreductase subunit NuoE [bacterium]|nr:NADH-quinone oxidoreductase subunit NuoE [bacterium]